MIDQKRRIGKDGRVHPLERQVCKEGLWFALLTWMYNWLVLYGQLTGTVTSRRRGRGNVVVVEEHCDQQNEGNEQTAALEAVLM